MAWGVTHRGEFYDLRGIYWTVDIELDGGSGAAAMKLTGDPLRIEWLAPSDDLLFGPVKGSQATINVWSETQFQYTSLYSAENFKRRVSIYHGSTLYWRGFLTSDYSEPYDDTPYRVSLVANDGLGLLKDMPYKYTTTDKNDTYYTGRRYESQVILDILGKIGHTAFKEFCNIYEDNIDSDTGDSPFDQILIDMDVFKGMYCYDVLEHLLKKYNAVIRQVGGEFFIYRPTEFDAATVYGRSFTAYNTKSAISVTPEQLINRTTASSDITDFHGGMLMMQPPLSQFTARQDYGYRESWIKNHNFDIETWNGYLAGNARFDDWYNVCAVSPVGHYSRTTRETEGVLINNLGVSAGVRQSFGTYAKECSNAMIFSFEYLLINTSLSAVTNVYVITSIVDDTDTYYLDNDGSDTNASWSTTPYKTVNKLIDSVPVGVGSWTTATYNFTGLPIDGPYTVTLLGATDADVTIGYRNIRFYSTSDDINTYIRKVSRWKKWFNMVTHFGLMRFFGGGYRNETTINIEDNEEVIERIYSTPDPATIEAPVAEQEYILGDCEDTSIVNVMEQFAGALAYNSSGSLVSTATDFVIDFADDYAALTSPSVLLTSVGDTLYFTSATAGTDFTGSTSIVNASGNLAGTPSTVTANAAGTKQKETLDLTAGTGGDFNVIVGAASHITTFVTSLTATATAFATNHAATFVNYGITVTASGTTIIFEETTAAGGFDQPIFYADPAGDMEGEWASGSPEQIAPVAATARVDKIILSGSSGTATVTCHANAETATFNTDTVVEYTSSWHTRGATEAKPVIELVADEVAAQYARERHFIQMSLRERGTGTPDLNMLYNIKDNLNTYSGSTRVFVANRGTFDVYNGTWSLDAHEII